MALSLNQQKRIAALHRKKGRDQQGLFLVEGHKSIRDFIAAGWHLDQGFCTEDSPMRSAKDFDTISAAELKSISTLDGPTDAVAVFEKQELTPQGSGPVLVLDRIQDPGNAGALLRLADWFGIAHVAWPSGTVEPWNPKVVQASMGALSRIPLVQQPAEDFISQFQEEGRAIVVADMGGQSPDDAFVKGENVALVMGNEGQGPDAIWSQAAQSIVAIPRAKGRQTESLNVATAAAILLYVINR